ncbi:MAG: hypothetical protein IKP43_06570 [Bacteroidaceae bacterium]|nr:hypothetical protein [Bacteroidaceae bacterium]
MKKYLSLCLLAAIASLTSSAQVMPKVKPEVPIPGKKYVLVNKAQNTSQYTSRTSWDGAFYFLNEEESHYADYALTAISNDDGSWSFSLLVPTLVNKEDEGIIWEGPQNYGSWSDCVNLEAVYFENIQIGDIIRFNITATSGAQLQISHGSSWANFDGLQAKDIKGSYDFLVTEQNISLLMEGIHIKGINYTLNSVSIIPVNGSEGEKETVDVTNYLVLPQGLANVNANSTEPAKWFLAPQPDGFYHFILGEGNNTAALAQAPFTPTGDIRMHLTNGGDYFGVTYYGGPFFPDCYGGIDELEDDMTGNVLFHAKDSISFNWGFVSVENVPSYYDDFAMIREINYAYANYCNIEGYGEGFKLTADAAASIYQKTSNPGENSQLIRDMIQKKKALYDEILKAIGMMEEENADFTKAIETAKTTFDTITNSATLDEAINNLKTAEMNYVMFIGNLTYLGVNMSFEDLSTQDGNETGSVSAPPAGWNVYINGKQVFTASEIQSGGIPNWHGINSDSYGEVKDGRESYGIWASNIPDFEISQTIQGLDNGTYLVTAGLMAGSNSQGSRLTTQRLFANFNSTYYASASDYDLTQLDENEIYSFAENEIIVTDQELRPVSVQAYVFDGTLTFGVRTNGNIAANYRTEKNPAGGDGWFKVDNFQLKKMGYQSEDALEVLNYYRSKLEEYTNNKYMMEKKVKTQLTQEIGDYSSINESFPQEDIDKAIVGAKTLFSTVNASVKAYARLKDAIDYHTSQLLEYESRPGAGVYGDVIMEVNENMENGLYDVQGVEDAIAQLEEALQACVQSSQIEEGMELTEFIQNPSFEDLSNQGDNITNSVANAPTGWNIYVEGTLCNTASELNAAGVTAWCGINNGDNLDIVNTYGETVTHQYTDGEHLWGLWSGAVPAFELSQTLHKLPAGTYTLTADIVVQNDWAGMNLGTQRLFANEYVMMYGAENDYIQTTDKELFNSLPADILGAASIDTDYPDATMKHLSYAGNYSQESYGASGAPYTTTLTFGLAQEGDITFGVRSNRVSAVDGMLSEQPSLGWLKVDNFRLTYDSAEVPVAAEATDLKTISRSGENKAMGYYSTSGVLLAAPQKGINIVRMSDGTVKKILLR